MYYKTIKINVFLKDLVINYKHLKHYTYNDTLLLLQNSVIVPLKS